MLRAIARFEAFLLVLSRPPEVGTWCFDKLPSSTRFELQLLEAPTATSWWRP